MLVHLHPYIAFLVTNSRAGPRFTTHIFCNTRPTFFMSPRRSSRLKGLSISLPDEPLDTSLKRRKLSTNTDGTSKGIINDTYQINNDLESKFHSMLPRTREESLKAKNLYSYIIGVDESGRGPLAGPVVAAAAYIPANINGITDSKKLTNEEDREMLYEKIIRSPNARWAVAISDAKRIDEINILQATLEAMKAAVQSTISFPILSELGGNRQVTASSKIDGCYVVCGSNDSNGKPYDLGDSILKFNAKECYALIDGNRLPKDMPCDCEAIVKGDSREYCIGAASILAKVTRDRLMHEYHLLYPKYDLSQHKGYPTASHMAKVKEFGASKIHRRTFAPLKHMNLDEDGNIVPDESQ